MWLIVPENSGVSTCSAGSGGSHSPCNRGAKLRVTVRSTHTPSGFSRRTWPKVLSMLPQCGVMLRLSENPNLSSSDRSISSQAGSPARTCQSLGSEKDSTESGAGCSLKSSESFAWLDPDTSSWKTSQACLWGGWIPYSESWPKRGTMRNGQCWERTTLGPIIDANESGYWPTPTDRGNYNRPQEGTNSGTGLATAVNMWPTPKAQNCRAPSIHGTGGMELQMAVQMWPTPNASDSFNANMKDNHDAERGYLQGMVQMVPTPRASDWKDGQPPKSKRRDDYAEMLPQFVKMFPTPRASDSKESGPVGSKSHRHMKNRKYLCAVVKEEKNPGGQLNPQWVEWLMGYSSGWTALDV